MPIMTAQELIRTIADAVDIADLPQPQTAVLACPGAPPTKIELAKDVPFDPNSVVIGIFHDDEVIRIYSLGKAAPNPPPAGWKPSLPTRYVLTRTAPTYVSEVMSMDTMAAEMIDEWVQVAEGMNSAKAEREAVVAWLETFVPDMQSAMFNEIIADIREGVHVEPDDDDDEEEEDEPEVVAAPTGVAGPTTVTIQPSVNQAVPVVSAAPAVPS
jgi:hypothetical protein